MAYSHPIRGYGTGAGRKKGTPNKTTPEQNTLIRKFINKELASLEGIAKKKPALFLRIMNTQTARRAFAMNHLTDKTDPLAQVDLTKLTNEERTATLAFISQIKLRRRLANLTDYQLCMEHYKSLDFDEPEMLRYGSVIGYEGEAKLAAQLRSQLIASAIPMKRTPEHVADLRDQLLEAKEKVRQSKSDRKQGIKRKPKRTFRVTATKG
jgi:hypothetical protein